MFLTFCVATLVVAQMPDSLTLSEALARARAVRPRVAGAAATVERARGAARLGSIIPNPTAQLETDDLSPTAKVTVVQSLAWLPRRGADLAAGRAAVSRAAADSAQILADVGRDVRRAFFGALAAEREMQLVTEQTLYADSLASLAARRAAAGDISDLERDQVAQEASRARLAGAQAREASRIARADLARAVAMDAAAPPRPAGSLDDGLDTTTMPTAEGLANIPSLRSALADSAAAVARLRSARIAQFPVPGVVAGREWGGISKGNTILGLNMPLPLWSQGREALAEARGAAAMTAAQTAETRLTLSAQVESTRIRVAESAARARFARDSLLVEARRIRAGAVRLYEAGRTSVLPVLDALRVERDVGRAVAGELLAFQQARADLDALIGKWP